MTYVYSLHFNYMLIHVLIIVRYNTSMVQNFSLFKVRNVFTSFVPDFKAKGCIENYKLTGECLYRETLYIRHLILFIIQSIPLYRPHITDIIEIKTPAGKCLSRKTYEVSLTHQLSCYWHKFIYTIYLVEF